ncbi:lens epithelial cell protein LEP503 isoform X1 [Lutra lutra]|uniref:lens epithelial cell protein LEP503 isoform X1 n=1 Tax=Lutra lutra TaxID=9657 RepID=UPI001FD287D5|nr:lens epithelial cell protein LEP503 isoform X1 [Lutra lutra]
MGDARGDPAAPCKGVARMCVCLSTRVQTEKELAAQFPRPTSAGAPQTAGAWSYAGHWGKRSCWTDDGQGGPQPRLSAAPSPAPIKTPGARHAPSRRGPRHCGKCGSCFRCAVCWSGLSGPPFPAPTSGGPPEPRSSACWPGPQEDRRRSWHFSKPGTVSPPGQKVDFSVLS